MKIVNSDIVFIQNGLGEAKNENKKNLFLNFLHSRPVQGNSEKKKAKKYKKLKKKTLSSIIISQNGIILAEKERKKF